jgi:ATP-dependent 26S proteasome regulatory subunit
MSPTALPSLKRKLEDFVGHLAKRFGEMRGKLEISTEIGVRLQDLGGLAAAKREIQGLAFALTAPDLHRRWGTTPPNGVLLYGPAGSGKTLLAKALASQAQAVFFHVHLANIFAKWPAESGEILHEIVGAVKGNGRGILYLDELEAIPFDRPTSSEELRGSGRRLVSALVENLDDLQEYEQALAIASTDRADAVDPALIRRGRFDRFIEVPLPEAEEREEILRLHQARAEALAGRPIFAPLSYDALIPRTAKMSGADLAEILQRALEEKVRLEGSGAAPGLVTTEDLQREIEHHRRTKELVEKIRYGQYL